MAGFGAAVPRWLAISGALAAAAAALAQFGGVEGPWSLVILAAAALALLGTLMARPRASDEDGGAADDRRPASQENVAQ